MIVTEKFQNSYKVCSTFIKRKNAVCMKKLALLSFEYSLKLVLDKAFIQLSHFISDSLDLLQITTKWVFAKM